MPSSTDNHPVARRATSGRPSTSGAQAPLEAWLCLQECLCAELPDGTRAHAECDPTQVGDRRLSAVQYLMFNLPDALVVLGCDLPVPEGTVAIYEGQRSALADDLADDLG